MKRKRLELVGQRFSRLIVIEFVKINGRRGSVWLCRCDCGSVKEIHGSKLRNGYTQSCGCLSLEKLAEHRTKHGMYQSPTYRCWDAMVQRCKNKNSKGYENYGARGITVCDRWLVFENFLADMGGKPYKLQIDRIDNDGNYEPGNCRWTTNSVNASNRRPSHLWKNGGKRPDVKIRYELLKAAKQNANSTLVLSYGHHNLQI